MKRASHKRCSQPKTEPTTDVIRRYMQTLADNHQQEWQVVLTDAAPHWEYLLALHLRLVELERLEAGAMELL